MTRNFKKLLSTVAMAGFLGGAGCLGGAPANTTTNPNPTGTPSTTDPATPTPIANDPNDPTNANNTAGGTGTTFDHMDDNTIDPFQVLARIQEEGPPEVSTRMHSCGKMKYATLKNVLTSVGVTMTGTGTTPNGLYTSGAGALGKPDYANRIAETTQLSTAGAVRLYDIFIAASPAIITAIPNIARCKIAGTAAAMFDANGCTMAGIACLTGAPATQSQKDLCDSAVSSNTTDKVGTATTAPTVGQVIAVASLLAAAQSCE